LPSALDRSDAMNAIRLDGVVDIACAAELKTQLLDALAAGAEVRVDLDGVADLDVTWAQLIWAAQREAARSGVKFSFSGPVPEKIATALLNAGFQGFPGMAPGE
jgi:anti-anti-sigma regulatory factor